MSESIPESPYKWSHDWSGMDFEGEEWNNIWRSQNIYTPFVEALNERWGALQINNPSPAIKLVLPAIGVSAYVGMAVWVLAYEMGSYYIPLGEIGGTNIVQSLRYNTVYDPVTMQNVSVRNPNWPPKPTPRKYHLTIKSTKHKLKDWEGGYARLESTPPAQFLDDDPWWTTPWFETFGAGIPGVWHDDRYSHNTPYAEQHMSGWLFSKNGDTWEPVAQSGVGDLITYEGLPRAGDLYGPWILQSAKEMLDACQRTCFASLHAYSNQNTIGPRMVQTANTLFGSRGPYIDSFGEESYQVGSTGSLPVPKRYNATWYDAVWESFVTTHYSAPFQTPGIRLNAPVTLARSSGGWRREMNGGIIVQNWYAIYDGQADYTYWTTTGSIVPSTGQYPSLSSSMRRRWREDGAIATCDVKAYAYTCNALNDPYDQTYFNAHNTGLSFGWNLLDEWKDTKIEGLRTKIGSGAQPTAPNIGPKPPNDWYPGDPPYYEEPYGPNNGGSIILRETLMVCDYATKGGFYYGPWNSEA